MKLTTFQKVAIGAGIALFLLLLAGGGALFYFVNKSHNDLTAVQSAAYAQGEAAANSATMLATNAQMVEAIKNLQTLQAQTNSKLANIRVTAEVTQKKIDSYVVDPTHPQDVEKWANDTTKQMFINIQTDANKPAPEPVLGQSLPVPGPSPVDISVNQ